MPVVCRLLRKQNFLLKKITKFDIILKGRLRMFWLLLSFLICWVSLSAFLKSFGLQEEPAQFLSGVFLVLIILFTYYTIKKDTDKKIYDAVNEHYDTLCTKRDQSTYYDDYGNEKCEGFGKELIYFVENVIYPNKELEEKEKIKLAQKVADMMDIVQKERPQMNDKEEEDWQELEQCFLNPYEFEGNCKKILEKAGWTARTTPKSGDQGVDVVAQKDGKLIVVQCKLYNQPVGNKAVQEIVAGKTYYHADYAVVVTNSTFTKSARQLAKSCEVFLLNINRLKNIDDILQNK